MAKAEITIKVRAREDFVPAESVLTVLGKTLAILHDLERRIPLEDKSTEWKVAAASLQSPLNLTIACDDPMGAEIVREYFKVFEKAESSKDFPMEEWSEEILTNAKQIVSVLNNGVAQITFTAPGKLSVSPTQRVAATVDYVLAPVYEDYGTFEGKLETLSVHGKTRFNIYDALTGRKIECSFESERLEEAHSAFNKRVAVSGFVKYNRRKEAVGIRVDAIRLLKGGISADSIPRGIDLTGQAESGRYVRGLRNAE